MKNTSDMQDALLRAPNLDRFLSEQADHFQDKTFTDYLSSLLADRGYTKAELAQRSLMSEVYLYQILSGSRHPSRNRVLCIAFGLQASLDEVQQLLVLSGFAPLYVKDRRDAILIYGLSHDQPIESVNAKLFSEGEETIY